MLLFNLFLTALYLDQSFGSPVELAFCFRCLQLIISLFSSGVSQGAGQCRTRLVLSGACLSATLKKSCFQTSHISFGDSKDSIFPQGRFLSSCANLFALNFLKDLVVTYLCLLLLGLRLS